MKKSAALISLIMFLASFVPPCPVMAEMEGESGGDVSLAVLELDNKGGLADREIARLAASIRNEFTLSGRYRVMRLEEMKENLAARGIELMACSTEACVRMVGKVLGAEKLVVGSIEKIGRIFIITLQLVEVETGEIEETATEEYLGTDDELLGPVKKIARQIARTALPPTLEGMRIMSSPEGATVYLNNEPHGHTPLLLPDMEPGDYFLKLVLKGYEQYEEDVTLIPGEMREVSVTLAPLPAPGAPPEPPPEEISPGIGLITLNITPEGAQVRIDGELVGDTPLESVSVEAGEHELRIRFPGYQEFTTRVKVEKEKHVFLRGRLKALEREEPSPPQAVSFALLRSMPFPENPRPYRMGAIALSGLSFISAGICYFLTNQAGNEYSDAIDNYHEEYDTCYEQGTCYGNESLAGYREESEEAKDDFYSYRTGYYLSLAAGSVFLGIAGYLVLGQMFGLAEARSENSTFAVEPFHYPAPPGGGGSLGVSARVRF